MLDGLIGSQTRGVPGRISQAGKLKSKFLQIPGANTWLKNKLILTTSSSQISKLFRGITKVIQVQNVSVCNDTVLVESFLTKALRSVSKDLYRYDTDFEVESGRIQTFIANVLPQTFILCDDRFIMGVLKFCAAEISVLIDLFPDFQTRFSFEQQIKLFENSVKIHPDNWISFIKFHTACPLAQYMDKKKGSIDPGLLQQLKEAGFDPTLSNLPPRPVGFVGCPLIWTGHVKRFLKNKLNSTNQMAATLGFALFQGVKRGCDTVPDSFLLKEIKGHVIAMTTPPVHVPHTIVIDTYTGEEFTTYFDENGDIRNPDVYSLESVKVDMIESVFKKCVVNMFRTKAKPYVPKVHEPSHNSCFESSRAEGGAYAAIVDELSLKWVESPPVFCKGKVATNYSYERPSMTDVMDRCRKELKDKKDTAKMAAEFACFLEPAYVKKMQNVLMDTSVIPLCEPLKVRIITKSEALPSYACISLQKAMKTYINRFPSLVLTTRPLESTDFRKVWSLENGLEDKISEIFKAPFTFDFDQHVSGDYKAATDKLNLYLTQLLFNSFIDALDVPEEDRDVYRQVLFQQRLQYPKRYSKALRESELRCFDVTPDGEYFSVDQVNGQLMGSILSFPILCMANLACYKLALEEYINDSRPKGTPRYYVSMFDLPVLVNGDDIYFRSNYRFYAIWLKYISVAGFQLSVGKNYIHYNTFTINSQCFRYNTESDALTECTYLNTGLLIGQSKGGVAEGELPEWDLYNKVLRGAHNKSYAHNRFLYHHKNNLRLCSHKGFYNFFLPKSLGGLGFVRPSLDIPVEITQKQRQLATYLHNQITAMYEKPFIGSLPLSTVTLIDKNAPKFLLPYKGEPVYVSYKVGEFVPDGYGSEVLLGFGDPIPTGYFDPTKPPKDEDSDNIMIHSLEQLNSPFLSYRGISTSVWNAFQKSNRYRGKTDWFGLESALAGKYPYRIAQSIEYDQETYKENLTHLVVKEVVDDLIGSVMANLTSQDDPQIIL